MPSSTWSALLAAVRAAFVALGVGAAAATVLGLASMPPPPPESDGFVRGMAVIAGGAITVLSLGLAALGVSLPALLGRDDPLGFGRWQRRALKGAGVLVAGGAVVGLAFGLATELQYGVVLWFGLAAVAICVVCATLAWRLAGALLGLLSRTLGGSES